MYKLLVAVATSLFAANIYAHDLQIRCNADESEDAYMMAVPLIRPALSADSRVALETATGCLMFEFTKTESLVWSRLQREGVGIEDLPERFKQELAVQSSFTQAAAEPKVVDIVLTMFTEVDIAVDEAAGAYTVSGQADYIAYMQQQFSEYFERIE